MHNEIIYLIGLMGVEIINLAMGEHLSPLGVLDSLQRGFQVCTVGDVHPNVTAKLIRCSLSYFYLITVMTCDD